MMAMVEFPEGRQDVSTATAEHTDTTACATKTTTTNGATDTHRLLADLKSRMEQLEKHCHFEHPTPIISSSLIATGPRRHHGSNPRHASMDDSVSSTVSMSLDDEFSSSKSLESISTHSSTGTNRTLEGYHQQQFHASSPAIVSPCHVGVDASTRSLPADSAAASAPITTLNSRRERIAKLRESKRHAELLGFRQIKSSHNILEELARENEELKQKQLEWEQERAKYQQAMKDMSALVRGLQTALCSTSGAAFCEGSSVATATTASTRDTYSELSLPSAKSTTPEETSKSMIQTQQRKKDEESQFHSSRNDAESDSIYIGDDVHEEHEVDLTPETALELTLTNTRFVIEQLDEERQKLAAVAHTQTDQKECMESVIRAQQETILQLQEEKTLQKVKIDSLQDMVLQSLQLLQEQQSGDFESQSSSSPCARQKSHQNRIALQAQAARALLLKTGAQVRATSEGLGAQLKKGSDDLGAQLKRGGEDLGAQLKKGSEGLGNQLKVSKAKLGQNAPKTPPGKRVFQASRNLWAMASKR